MKIHNLRTLFSKEKKETSKDEKLELLQAIQPRGGISFRDEKFINTGDGYEACLHIWDFPDTLDTFWLDDILNIDNTIATVDVYTDDKNEVRKNLNKSLTEYSVQVVSSASRLEAIEASKTLNSLDTLATEITSYGEVIKIICVRIFIAQRSQKELDETIRSVTKKLESDGFQATILLNEGRREWISTMQSYTEQRKAMLPYSDIPMQSSSFANGDPFHFTALYDEHGLYLGYTPVGGRVIFDSWKISSTRKNYNALVVGNMGAGKSTLLKKLGVHDAICGNYIRGFDVADEYKTIVETLGGKMVSLDGSSGIINALEILETADDQSSCFQVHIAKIGNIFKFLVPECTSRDIIALEKLLQGFYMDYGIIDPKKPLNTQKLTGRPANTYPIWSDFLDYIGRVISGGFTAGRGSIQAKIKEEELLRYNAIRQYIANLVDSYGSLFNGHTSIENLLDTPVVFFNIKNLSTFKSEIFDAQMYMALLLCWDNCNRIGARMRRLYNNQEIAWEDITRFMIYIDEAHRIVNTNKLHAVEQLTVFAREARKNFGGIILATQSISDFVPDGSDSEAIEKIRVLFSLSQYKYIMQQDTSAVEKIDRVFSGTLTQSELKEIPTFEKGDCMLAIASDRNLRFTVEITDEEKRLFTGGA